MMWKSCPVKSQEDKPQTHRSDRQITRETVIFRSKFTTLSGMIDTEDTKERLVTEWTNLDHVIIANAVRPWRPTLTAGARAYGEHFKYKL